MPLTKTTVTAASRIMLPTYTFAFALIGVNYLIDAPRLQVSPGLAFADSIMPLPAWGAWFCVCSLIMAGSLLMHKRTAYTVALWMCVAAESVWALCLFAGIFYADLSVTAWVRDAFMAVACFASYRSLVVREV